MKKLLVLSDSHGDTPVSYTHLNAHTHSAGTYNCNFHSALPLSLLDFCFGMVPKYLSLNRPHKAEKVLKSRPG